MKRWIICVLMFALAGDAVSAPATSSAKATAPASSPAASNTPASTSSPAELAKKLVALHERSVRQFGAGEIEKAKATLQEILALDQSDEMAWYNLACADCRLGDKTAALRDLNSACDHLYADFRFMQHDDDLAGLRDLPGYKTLLARNEKVQQLRASSLEEQLKKELGDKCIYEIDHKDKFVFGTTVDKPTLDDVKARLQKEATALWADLFSNKLEQYVTVAVPSPDYRSNNPMLAGGGFYDHAAKMLVVRQVGMVLQHEFAHALHDADQDALGQRHPIWIIEGFSTFCEVARFDDGHVTPLPSHRLNMLQMMQARKRLIPWADFFKLEQPEYMKKADVSYPQSRYILIYLFDKGLLTKWYKTYTQDYKKDPTGAAALAKVFDKPIDEIEADWQKWVAQQKPPLVALPANHAYMGVATSMSTDGLTIQQIVRGSGADKAGLKPGDTITSIDNERVMEPEALLNIVDAHQVGDKLEVGYRRDGKYQSATVTLAAMPSASSAGTTTRAASSSPSDSQPSDPPPRRRRPRLQPTQ